jgi:hypothetical protein
MGLLEFFIDIIIPARIDSASDRNYYQGYLTCRVKAAGA